MKVYRATELKTNIEASDKFLRTVLCKGKRLYNKNYRINSYTLHGFYIVLYENRIYWYEFEERNPEGEEQQYIIYEFIRIETKASKVNPDIYILWDKVFNKIDGYCTVEHDAEVFLANRPSNDYTIIKVPCFDKKVSKMKDIEIYRTFVSYELNDSNDWELVYTGSPCGQKKMRRNSVYLSITDTDDRFELNFRVVSLTNNIDEIKANANELLARLLMMHPKFKEGYINPKDVKEFDQYLKQEFQEYKAEGED